MQNKQRTKAQWLEIFDEQKNSGLTIKAFCERQGINLQTFRARKSDWKHRDKKPGRALVKIETSKPKPVATISFQFNGVELACTDSVNPLWFANMVKALVQ